MPNVTVPAAAIGLPRKACVTLNKALLEKTLWNVVDLIVAARDMEEAGKSEPPRIIAVLHAAEGALEDAFVLVDAAAGEA